MSKLLKCNEVLEVLTIKDRKVVGYLVERELLPRIELGPRSFRYDLDDCLNLIERAKNEGINLTLKP